LLRLSVFIAVDRLPAMAAMAASETAKAACRRTRRALVVYEIIL
jgi:hypothetical protein